MRPGQNKRMRGRPNTNSSGNRKGPNPLTRSYESNGPDVKIRGNAHHVAEKYLQLARDAQSSGDPVAAESYLQHAEHYFRLIATAQLAQTGGNRQPDGADVDGDDDEDSGIPDRFASPQAPAPPAPSVPQPYAAERQPYNGERQPYSNDRQPTPAGERQPYADRHSFNGERPQPQDRGAQERGAQERNGYERPQRADRPDRNGMGRRPYRDNNDRGSEFRAGDDRGPDRNRYQERRNGQDRGYDRNSQERLPREPQAEAPRGPYVGEQPRIDAAEPLVAAPASTPSMSAPPVLPPMGARDEPAPRVEPVRRPERTEAARSAAPHDGPGLPSFITAPTRVAPAEPNLATPSVFPGEDLVEAAKFPRRRRRPTRGTAADGIDAASEQPVIDE